LTSSNPTSTASDIPTANIVGGIVTNVTLPQPNQTSLHPPSISTVGSRPSPSPVVIMAIVPAPTHPNSTANITAAANTTVPPNQSPVVATTTNATAKPASSPSPLQLGPGSSGSSNFTNGTVTNPNFLDKINAFVARNPSAPQALAESNAPVQRPAMKRTRAPTKSMPPPTRPTTADTNSNAVRVQNYYIAYRAPAATKSPSHDEFEQMRSRTERYYQTFLAQQLNNSAAAIQLVSLTSVLNTTAFGVQAGIPSDNFNIYMQYQYTEFTFGNATSDSEPRPNTDTLYELLKSGITVDYILEIVRSMTDTPFESCIEVFLSTAD
jgi:hypothetical protein